MARLAEAEGQRANSARAKKPVTLSGFAGHDTAALEHEADVVAEQALAFDRGVDGPLVHPSSSTSTGAQASCGCEGPCTCNAGIQRWRDPGAMSTAAGLVSAGVGLVQAALSPTIVEDDAEPGDGQIRRSTFLVAARAAIVSSADEELARVGRSTANCPYIEYWWGRFRGYSAARMERAVMLFARPASRSPSAYVVAMSAAARERVQQWIASGSAAVPEDIDAMSAIADGAGESAAQARSESGEPSRPSIPNQILSRLGAGTALEGSARSRMERGFGHSFRDVRIHTDATASSIAAERGALALTVGSNILFRDGRYLPGTMSGDVLLAHELAHTIQQRGGGELAAVHEGESEADSAAAKAVAAARGFGSAPEVGRRSGVGVQACTPTRKRCPPGMAWGNVAHQTGTAGAGSFGCACTYRCVTETYYPSEPSICPASGCARIRYETVGEDYEFRVDGEVQRVPVASRASPDEVAHGWGASSTPLTGEHMCLCGGVDIEGDSTGVREGVSITPIAVDATDVVGPVAEIAAGRRASNTRTGVRQPETEEAPTPRRSAPMTPPPEHVGAPPVRDQPGGAPRALRVGEPNLDSPFPHVQQREGNWCGAACGEMAARRLGVEIDQAALVRTPYFEPRFAVGDQVVTAGGFQTLGLARALTDVAPVAGRRWVGGTIHQDISTPQGLRTHLQGYLDATGASVILRVGGTDHWIVVDSILPDGRIAIRDPGEEQSSAVTAAQLSAMRPNGDAVFSFARGN